MNGVPFADACATVAAALDGDTRRTILDSLPAATDLREPLQRLRQSMRAHAWKAASRTLRFDRIVQVYDAKTRADGFHVLHDWDGRADRVNADTIPVDMLNFLIDQRGDAPFDRQIPAILVDYYFFYILTLLAMRIWDDGDPNQHLGRLTRLLTALQGPDGSGQRFVADAESLFLIVGSHYEPHEAGFDRLLDRVRQLDAPQQQRVALGHAASLGSHLRFGFEATYGGDLARMRADNVVDYPWLLFSLVTLIRAFEKDRAPLLIEVILNGLAPDVDAFAGSDVPAALSTHGTERAEFHERFSRHRAEVLADADRHRPLDSGFSPMAFYFNFCQNVLKGIVADALLWGEPWDLTLNDLLMASADSEPRGAAKQKCARMLMRYAQANPDPIRGRLMPAIVYDPALGRRSFAAAMRRLRDAPP